MDAIHLLILSLLTLTLTPKPVLSLPLHKLPNFGPGIQVTSSGLLNTKPFTLLPPTSFFSDFTFSGDALALVFLAPTNKSKLFAVEFDAATRDVVSVRVSISNVSSPLNVVLPNGGKAKLKAWVDYWASAKSLEVRLTEAAASRPYNPSIYFPVDLSKVLGGEEVLVGIISSSSGDSKQISSTSVFSWRFSDWSVPNGMHSQPVDPLKYSDEGGEKRKERKESSCPLSVVCGLMLGMACGALVAFVAFFLWTVAVDRHSVVPLEYLKKHPVGFEYEKA